MSKNKKNKPFGLVFSTDPDFKLPEDNESDFTPEPGQQDLRVLIDRKKRKGKEVTLVTGFEGSTDELKALGKMLKTKCGVGGTAKEGEILIQGNHRNKVIELLKDAGYRVKASGGG